MLSTGRVYEVLSRSGMLELDTAMLYPIVMVIVRMIIILMIIRIIITIVPRI